MNLSDVRKAKIPRKYKFVKGRGHSSGVGKTCGRGRKGQYARQGTSFRPYFEGGQMPFIRRLPKRGFNNAEFKTDFEVVNVGQLEKLFAAGEAVNAETLRAKGLVRRDCDGVKILGDGTLTKKLAIKVESCTKSAEEKIQKAGGSVERLIPLIVKKVRVPAPAPAKPGAPAGKAPEGKPEKPKGKPPEGKAPESKPEPKKE